MGKCMRQASSRDAPQHLMTRKSLASRVENTFVSLPYLAQAASFQSVHRLQGFHENSQAVPNAQLKLSQGTDVRKVGTRLI